MILGSLDLGGDGSCAVIAEIGNAHNGSYDRAVRLIDAAHAAGASAVKFQCFQVDEIVALRGDGPAPAPWDDRTMAELYAQAMTPQPWFASLIQHCHDIGIPWFSSVFGMQSLAFLESMGCPAYKVARLDNGNAPLRNAVFATGKPVIVSGATLGDLTHWVWEPEQSWKGERRREPAALSLYCAPGYPQPAPFTDLRARFDRQRCDGDVAGCYIVGAEFDGFSYHGTDPLPCVIAATLGATMIEAHVQLDDEPSELEANVSLTASQFAQMVRDIRRVEAMLA